MTITAAETCMLVTRSKSTIFMPLPPSLWRPIDGGCSCSWCEHHQHLVPMWDTLAVGDKAPSSGADYTWTVHHPSLANPLGREYPENTEYALKGE